MFIEGNIRGSGLLKRRWLYHALFWLGYFVLTIILYMGVGEKITPQLCLIYLANLVVQAATAYFNIYVLIPRLIFARKYVAYAIAIFFATVICAYGILGVHWIYMYLEGKLFDNKPIFTLSMISVWFVQEVYLLGMTTGLKFVKDSILNQQWMKEKEKHYLETELKFLKSQIQPHFFFNTLNNIYSLTLKKSDQAPEVVLKLSDLMSYMLYESNAPRVPLSREINYLQNYLDVEHLRFGQRLSVSFVMEGATAEVSIPPMILILFLENSFKHGVKNNISKIHIGISLQVKDDYLYFRVENPVSDEEPAGESNGIGLKNARRRLDLLYGNDYSLDILEQDRKFIVSLKIPVC